MNKEMVTCGAVTALAAAMYFLGGDRPSEAARFVQRERQKLATQSFLELEVAPVHRVERLDRVRNPDDVRRFVDARERDPFARPRIGERLALPDLAPPQLFPDELELLPPPPAPHGSWRLIGRVLRGRAPVFPPELIAPEESTEANGGPTEPGNPPPAESEVASAPPQAPKQDSIWQGPNLGALNAPGIALQIDKIWPDRWLEDRAGWLDAAFERWTQLAPNDVDALAGTATWLDESLRWDEAFEYFREKLTGSQGEGPHGRDPRAMLAYGRFLQRIGLREEGAGFLARCAEALGSTPLPAAKAQAIWCAASRALCASGRAKVAWATRPAQPLEAATWAAIVFAAYGAGEGAELSKVAQAGTAALAASGTDKDPAWTHARLLAAFLERGALVKPRSDGVEAFLAHAEQFVQLGGEARTLGAPALDLSTACELAAARCDLLAADRAADEVGIRATSPERREALGKLRQGALDAVPPLLVALRDRLNEVGDSGTLDAVGAHRGLAWIYLLAGDDQLAEVEAHVGLAIDPDDEWLRYLCAAILLRRGEFALANEAFAALLRSAPDFQDALALAGASAWLSGDVQRAGSLLDRVVLAEDTFAEAAYLSGLAELGRGRFDWAEQRFQKALRLEPLFYEARAGQGLVRYQRLRAQRDISQVMTVFEELVRKLETEDLRDPLLRYLRDLVTQLDRASNAREFVDAFDRDQPLALFEWEPAVEVEGVRALLKRWAPAEIAAQPNAYGAQVSGSALRIEGRFKARGRTAFWTQTLIERPIDFLSVEADLWVPANNKARVGIALGRMPLDAGKGPDLANATLMLGVSNLVDEAIDQRTTQYILLTGGQGQEWISDASFLEKPFDWPADQPVRVRLEARHYADTADVRITVGGKSVHPRDEWLELKQMRETQNQGGFKLVFFAEGDAEQPVELRVDNIRVQYRDQ